MMRIVKRNGGRRGRRLRAHAKASARGFVGTFGRLTKAGKADWTKPLSRIDALYWASKSLKGRARQKNPLLQVVMPNRTKRMRLMKIRGLKRASQRRLKYLLEGPRHSGVVKTSGRYMKRRRRNPAIRGYRGRGGSRVRGGQRISGVRFATAAEARTYPGFAKALETYKKFHGRAPTHFTKVRLEDGDAHVSRRAVVMIGEAPAIEYRTWRYANSTKSHTKDGRRITWRHKMGELGGKPAYYVHDPVSGVTSLLGGTYKVAGRPAFYHH